MNKIPMLERFAAQSLVEHAGELIFSKEKFAELIVAECVEVCHKLAEDSDSYVVHDGDTCAKQIKQHFGVKE